MTNALDKTNAAAQAQGRLARLARQGVALCMLACAGIGVAQAQYHGHRDDAQVPARAERVPAPAQQIEQPRERGYDQLRDQQREQQRAYEEQRRQAAQAQGEANREGGRRGGRLTPDERRDLRRQINEAGMDIYPNAQRR
jgi:flagellar biosynthesis/type III secretory pathway protein FliH